MPLGIMMGCLVLQHVAEGFTQTLGLPSVPLTARNRPHVSTGTTARAGYLVLRYACCGGLCLFTPASTHVPLFWGSNYFFSRLEN